MLVGWWIRRTLGESPAFEEEQEHHDVPKAPLKVLFRNYTPDVFKVLFAALASVNSTIFGQFALAYGVNTMGLSAQRVPVVGDPGQLRRAVRHSAWPGSWRTASAASRCMRSACSGVAVTVWPFLWAISQRNMTLMFVFGVLMVSDLLQRIRRSGFRAVERAVRHQGSDVGVAVGTQFGFALGGFAPAIAAALAGPKLDNWVPVAVFSPV